jgi:predicted nicotinamide N-methyase
MLVDVLYADPQAHEIVNVALHWEYSPDIVFVFSQLRKDLILSRTNIGSNSN